MPSKQSEAVRRRWEAARLAMVQPDGEGPDDESWGDLTAEPRGVDYLETEAGSRPAMWAVPKSASADRVLLCIHGGGFVSGSIYTHRKMFGHLAKAAGARALLVEYRLLPEGGAYPVPVDEVEAAYRWLLDQGTAAGHVAFAGDSTGGWLAVTVQLRARDQGLPLPAAAMLLSPAVDMEVNGESFQTNRDKDPFFHRELVRGLIRSFLGEAADPRDPLVNPLYADLTGLAPVYIQAGGDETLLDDARLLDEHARKAGVDVRLDVFPGMLHTFQMAAGRAPEADDAIRRMADWVRAWRSYGTFKGRSSLRTWLYRIATNACLTALEQRGRRALPSGLGGPAEDPDAPPGPAEPEVAWLGPIPDTLVTSDSQDPATIVAAREGLRLALIASLQHLPARQRAVLLLRDVLSFPAAEVAAMLGTSAAAVKSTLQRARARLEEAAPAPESVIEPTDPYAQALLGQYIAGFQNADTAALEKALRTDAAIELVGTRTWFSGRVTCLRYLAHVIGSPGDWLMTPTRANGQPAAATYYRNGDGTYRALGVAVLTVTLAGITRITVFADGPGLVATFGFPPTHPGRGH